MNIRGGISPVAIYFNLIKSPYRCQGRVVVVNNLLDVP